MSSPEHEPLAQALHRARDALAAAHPPPAVQQALRAAFAALPPRPPPATCGAALAGVVRLAHAAAGARWWTTAACAVLLLVSTALLLQAPLNEPAPPRAAAPAALAFVPVATADRWPQPEPGPHGAAQAWLVAAEMPRERLAAWGLAFDPARAAEPVRAELLLRPSGEVLAVRVVHAAAGR